MDYVDLFQLHNPPAEALREGALRETLDRLQAAGKIRAWGISAKSPAEAIEALVEFGAPVVQANFNMMDVRIIDSGLLHEVERRGAGFIGRTPLCFGFLSGAIGRDTTFPPGDHRLGWSRAQLDNWIDGASDLLSAVGARPGRRGRTPHCASAWPCPRFDHHSRHPDAAKRSECSGQRRAVARRAVTAVSISTGAPVLRSVGLTRRCLGSKGNDRHGEGAGVRGLARSSRRWACSVAARGRRLRSGA